MTKEFDLLVFIGRFQPYHNGHHHVVKKACELAKKVLILVGSSNGIRDSRNPFTFEERKNMIFDSLANASFNGLQMDFGTNVFIEPLNDHPYDEERWIEEVQDIVSLYDDPERKTGLIGHSKDNSSYYLKLFPNYESVDVYGVEAEKGTLLDATEVRKLFFTKVPNPVLYKKVCDMVPKGTKRVLDNFHNPEYEMICREIEFNNHYKEVWGGGPFVTVDAVVIQAGHVLLVERGDYPGKGQFALPGGFVESRETLENAVMRELKEETSIDVPPSVLKSRITHMQHFSYPWRSNRAHIITFAFLFDLNNEIDRKANSGSNPIGMTNVKGGDDAARAFWYPISQLRKDMLFEDHYDIIDIMLDKKSISKL